MKLKPNLSDTTLTAVFAAIITVMSQIAIPIPGSVPITLQTFAIALTAYTLGAKRGTISVLVYIFLGIVGIPVFSGFKGGVQVLFGATGGFIFGFLFMAFICGLAFKVKSVIIRLLFGLIGLLICHILGIIQFAVVYKTNIVASALTVSVPYLIKDIISVVLAYFIAIKVRSALQHIKA